MTTKNGILKAVRNNCHECACGSVKEIADCMMVECPMFAFRMGKDPFPSRGGFGVKRPVQTMQSEQSKLEGLLSPKGREYYQDRVQELADRGIFLFDEKGDLR